MKILEATLQDLGGIVVRRLLPQARLRQVGPFVFFDHFGPVTFAPGKGIDLPPHPHIGLATVSYLFEGSMIHRDSLGSHQRIAPGDINWMHTGRGIVHSERSDPATIDQTTHMHGLQMWVALPTDLETSEPKFAHHEAASLPEIDMKGVTIRVLAGKAYGATSPVKVPSPMFYVDAKLTSGRDLPLPDEYQERAAYVIEGRVWFGREAFETGRMLVFAPGERVTLRTDGDARVVLLGGDPLDGPRHIHWNFVASKPELIEKAREDWEAGRFDVIPGDSGDLMPLPPGPKSR
jgi:redox-sensitive bicupin YhaK (pirin superfamily)